MATEDASDQRASPFDHLTADVLAHALSFLSIYDVCHGVALTCTAGAAAATDPVLWASMVAEPQRMWHLLSVAQRHNTITRVDLSHCGEFTIPTLENLFTLLPQLTYLGGACVRGWGIKQGDLEGVPLECVHSPPSLRALHLRSGSDADCVALVMAGCEEWSPAQLTELTIVHGMTDEVLSTCVNVTRLVGGSEQLGRDPTLFPAAVSMDVSSCVIDWRAFVDSHPHVSHFSGSQLQPLTPECSPNNTPFPNLISLNTPHDEPTALVATERLVRYVGPISEGVASGLYKQANLTSVDLKGAEVGAEILVAIGRSCLHLRHLTCYGVANIEAHADALKETIHLHTLDCHYDVSALLLALGDNLSTLYELRTHSGFEVDAAVQLGKYARLRKLQLPGIDSAMGEALLPACRSLQVFTSTFGPDVPLSLLQAVGQTAVHIGLSFDGDPEFGEPYDRAMAALISASEPRRIENLKFHILGWNTLFALERFVDGGGRVALIEAADVVEGQEVPYEARESGLDVSESVGNCLNELCARGADFNIWW